MNLAFIALVFAALLCNISLAVAVEDKNCVVHENGEVVCTEEKAAGNNSSGRNGDDDDDDDDDDFDGFYDDDVVEDDEPVVDVTCKDNHELCGFWASKGGEYSKTNTKSKCVQFTTGIYHLFSAVPSNMITL